MGTIILLGVLPSYMLAARTVEGQQSSSLTKVSFYSESVEKNMNLNVYLPAGYGNGKKFPVLYILHKYDYGRLSILLDEILTYGHYKINVSIGHLK